MPYIMVDIEADGPIPGDYSMVSIGAVALLKGNNISEPFYAELKPISEYWIPQALAVSNITREKTLLGRDPKEVMASFESWLKQYDRPMFISDNNGFDWMFVCWYFHHFLGSNPFGYSSTNLGSLAKGLERNIKFNFKRLRKTKHDHNPVNDAKGNLEALIHFNQKYNLRLD